MNKKSSKFSKKMAAIKVIYPRVLLAVLNFFFQKKHKLRAAMAKSPQTPSNVCGISTHPSEVHYNMFSVLCKWCVDCWPV